MTTQALKCAAKMVASGESLQIAASLCDVGVVDLEVYMRVNHTPLREHSAGELYPYVIVLVGSFVDGFKYHVVGGKLTIGTIVCNSYQSAYDKAMHGRGAS